MTVDNSQAQHNPSAENINNLAGGEVSPRDLEIMSEQLGRQVRGVVAVAARTGDGIPTVVATAPRLEDGTPFPTHYYLTHPDIVAAVSTLEANGKMVEYNQLLQEDAELAAQYARAHEQYIADRDKYGEVPEISGVSAGGMPTRVKCLHALAGHALAAGEGINPIGDLVLREIGWDNQTGRLCYQRMQ